MRRVALYFGAGTSDYLMIEKAWDITREVHRGKLRKDGDELFSHERAIAIILMEHVGIRDPEVIAAAFLHDLVEDYEDWTTARIRLDFTARVARIVHAVTKPHRHMYMSTAQYNQAIFERVHRGGFAAKVLKCADRLHNMLTLFGTIEKKSSKILQTIEFIQPMAANIGVLRTELELATTEQILKLNEFPIMPVKR